ncbi:MAG: outer membrane protein assembly factor BamD [Rhodospirillales bacterium]
MPNARSPRRLFAALAVLGVFGLAGGLAGCAGDEEEPYIEEPVEILYNRGINALNKNDPEKAQKEFQEVERQHPYSTWATKAQLMGSFAAYLRREYDEAIIGLNRFIQLHPSHRDVAYAYYLRGLSYYEQISDVARDQKMTQEALGSLTEVFSRFPESKYARDAKVKVDLTYDHLAGKEMEIGRYYQTSGHYLAAINRFKTVVDRHQTTTHVPEALHRLAESYYTLGMTEEAARAAAILGHNYPGSDWYIDAYELVSGEPFREQFESQQERQRARDAGEEYQDSEWWEFWEDGGGDAPAPAPEAAPETAPAPEVEAEDDDDSAWWEIW